MENLINMGNETSVWDEIDWEIEAPNMPVSIVEAPTSTVNIKSSGVAETLPGDFVFFTVTKKRYIDEVAHQSMLEKSMKENAGIWRKLADI